MIGLTRYVELAVINRVNDVSFGGNRREMFDPGTGRTVLDFMQQIGLPRDYDYWFVQPDGRLTAIEPSFEVANEDVFVFVHRGFGLTDEQAAAEYHKLKPIMPSREAVFREGSA